MLRVFQVQPLGELVIDVPPHKSAPKIVVDQHGQVWIKPEFDKPYEQAEFVQAVFNDKKETAR